MQSGLIELERRIDDWDNTARRSQKSHLPLSMRRWETFEELAKDPQRPEYGQLKKKVELEAKLKEGIREYHEALLLQAQICNLDRPGGRVLSAFRSFLTKLAPILSGKAKQMLDAKDLAALRPPADADPLSRLLRDLWPFGGLAYPDPRDNTQHFPESHVEWIVLVISTVIAAILLIRAITSLYFVSRPGLKLGLIATFTTLNGGGQYQDLNFTPTHDQ